MNYKNKDIKKLITFFTISNAAFNLVATINNAFGKPYEKTTMHLLHELALHEITKPKPHKKYFLYLLELMEFEAEKLTKNK